MILGLDISTSRIGIAIIDDQANLITCEEIKMKSSDPLETRAEIFETRIKEIRSKYVIKHVFVEQPFMAFSGGKTTAVTMAKLQRFNGMCCYITYNLFGSASVLIPANKARGLVGLKIPRGQKAKTRVIEWVSERYPQDFIVEYTRHGNPKPGTDDKADAIVIANAGLKLNQETI
jgi:Holliday junction resolvasome RuvABC endonuclease subunit